MPSKDSLFELIDSMSSSQKRYFKIYCRDQPSNKRSNYLKLFNAIDQMQIYDEQKLKTKFSTEKFINHLSSEKNYLSELILKAMRAFMGDQSIDTHLKNLLNDIHFLYHNNLYTHCYRRLNKAAKLAVKNERYLVLLELAEWEKYLNKFNVARFLPDLNSDKTARQYLLKKHNILESLIAWRLKLHKLTYLSGHFPTEDNKMEMEKYWAAYKGEYSGYTHTLYMQIQDLQNQIYYHSFKREKKIRIQALRRVDGNMA